MSPEGAEGETGALRYDAVPGDPQPSGAREVHPGVQPMSHSVKRGFNCRREVGADSEDSAPGIAVAGAGRETPHATWFANCPSCGRSFSWCAGPFAPFASCADGVAHGRLRACWSSPISSFRSPPRLRKLSVPGVCHSCTRTWSEVIAVRFAFVPSLSPMRCFIARCPSGVLLSSFATGVGQDEEPFALVGGADFRRREEAFRDPVAKAFEVWANNVEVSKPKVSCHVFEEAPAWLALSDDSRDARPEVSGVCGPETLPGNRERLAGITSNDSIHAPAPASSIEGVEVAPNRRVIQGTVRNTRSQDFAGSDFVFHENDGASASAQSVMHSEVETSCAGTEAKDPLGT